MKPLGRLLLALALLLGAAAPAAAAWLRAESRHFIVYSDGKEDELRRQARLLEDFDQLLRILTSAPRGGAENKLELYLVRSEAELRKVRNAGGGVSGFYDATPEGIAAFARRKDDGSGFGADEIILHEYAHHFMLQNFPANYPTWYIEGFAEYVATAKFSEEHIEIGRFNENRASWLQDFWLPLDRMLTRDTVPLESGREVARFYAQSWLMVHYLMRDPERRAKLQAYLRAFGAGKDPKATFRSIFAVDATEFTRQLRGYGRKMTFTRITRSATAAPVPIEITRLPPAADDLLLFHAGLKLGLTDWSAYPLLPRVRRAAAAHAGDPLATKTLIRAELLYGDRAKADALIDGVLKAAPNDRDALYLKGLAHILAGRTDTANKAAHFAKARPWLARAHKADENFYPALIRYAESYTTDAGYSSENVSNILLLATQLAPQVSLIRLNAAHQHAVRGEKTEAEHLLGPIVNEPHSKLVREAAQALMKKIKAGATPEPSFYVERLEKDEK